MIYYGYSGPQEFKGWPPGVVGSKTWCWVEKFSKQLRRWEYGQDYVYYGYSGLQEFKGWPRWRPKPTWQRSWPRCSTSNTQFCICITLSLCNVRNCSAFPISVLHSIWPSSSAHNSSWDDTWRQKETLLLLRTCKSSHLWTVVILIAESKPLALPSHGCDLYRSQWPI